MKTASRKIILLDSGQHNTTTAIATKKLTRKELQREYSRKYYRRPEVIARRKTPEMIARKAQYDKLYGKRPEVRERKRVERNRRYQEIGK